MDDLTRAIMAAGEELAHEHTWCFDGDPGVPPDEDNPFVGVVRKHVLPLIGSESWKEVRIAGLKAELHSLENSLN